jgi:6-phosphogluconolactonase (cycloisomerase 2 family)
MLRRQFNGGLLGLTAASALSSRLGVASDAGPAMFYVGSGSSLYGVQVDAATGSLKHKHGPYELSQEIQSACQSPRTGHLYVVASQGFAGREHFLLAFAVAGDGSLKPAGDPVTLPERPININVDGKGEFLLVAYPRPSGIGVHHIARDGALADEVKQLSRLDTGIYPHEIRVFPSNRTVLTMSRGTQPTADSPEQLGAIRLYSFDKGQLANVQVVARDGGHDFRPRNIEFSRSGRWLYAVLEAQNEVLTYGLGKDRLSGNPLFTASTLASPTAADPTRQASGCRMHPDGRTFYVINRATGQQDFQGQKVQSGEENVAVFSLDTRTGEPRLVQSAALPGFGSRGMGISPDGRWMLVAGYVASRRRVGDGIEPLPVNLCLYSIAADGRLNLASKLEAPMQNRATIWAGTLRY